MSTKEPAIIRELRNRLPAGHKLSPEIFQLGELIEERMEAWREEFRKVRSTVYQINTRDHSE